MCRYGARDSGHSKEDKVRFLFPPVVITDVKGQTVWSVGGDGNPGGVGSLAKVVQGSDT